MLVVTRTVGEKIVIGPPANPIGVIEVTRVNGQKVRLACHFPKEIEINRTEVATRKLAEKGKP